MSARRKVCLVAITKIILLIIIGIFSEHALEQSTHNADWMWHTQEVLTELERLSAAIDETKGLQSFKNGKDPDERFRTTQQKITRAFNRATALTIDNPAQQQRLAHVRPLLTTLLREESAVVAGKKKKPKAIKSSPLPLSLSPQLGEQIQSLMNQMRTEEIRLLGSRARVSYDSFRRAERFILGGNFLAIIFVAFSALVVIRDLRSKERAERSLREGQQDLENRVRSRTADLSSMESRYRQIFETSPVPMIVLDADTLGFLTVNTATEELYGYTREEFLSMTLKDTQPSGDILALSEMGNKVEHHVYRTTFVSQHKDGHLLTIDIRASATDFGNRRAWLALITDVTEQKRLEAQLRQSQKMEAVGRLAGGVAHDFNNLLTIILGYCESVLGKLEQNTPLKAKVLEIQRAGQRAAKLTKQLLAFSRKQVLQPHVLDLNAVISEITEMLYRLLGEDIRISLQLASSLGQIRADRGQLEQVLVNLAVNARDAMPNGGRLLIETHNSELDQHSASLVGLTAGQYVLLVVSDNGCGMDDRTKARVFEPFFTTKDVGQGTGLGLSMVLGVVQQSGGTVTVYSELGEGTTFKIYLPRLDEPSQGEQAEKTPRPLNTKGASILLVEDEEQLRTWASQVLREAGCSVFEASNGREALEVAQTCPHGPALLLTDVVMPEMSGPELAQRLHAKWPNLPVVYASGYTEHALLGRKILEEDTPFLQKPYTANCLLSEIARVRARGAGSADTRETRDAA